MIAVVDTSAVLRMFIPDGPIPDGLEAFFRGVETGANLAIAPELLLVEALNVVVKKHRREELTTEEAESLMSLLRQMPIRYYGHLPYGSRACHLAIETGLSGYDAIFLALALDRGVPLFTADHQLEAVASRKGIGRPRG
ncbi:type II toxin-antitoxin system VapC family toxin [Puniceicoccales bacterium CK1056]|uniref:Ribonuclease VapC n=1 Tax=Oceanipulchritudo coccoides TaxID=2706888 RepID=A0A6B2M2W8_9BACT|nr:type II toxin-antitoxin system VapC family toxin [Oceanipulchritudo coccoides]NDV62427.1 type II toxin-antitoxin system VapC family toxin [Oceanipulchritudo coccoides]